MNIQELENEELEEEEFRRSVQSSPEGIPTIEVMDPPSGELPHTPFHKDKAGM